MASSRRAIAPASSWANYLRKDVWVSGECPIAWPPAIPWPPPGRRRQPTRPAARGRRRAAVVGGGGLLEACSSSKGNCGGSTSSCPSGLVIGPSEDATGAADTAAINAVVGAGGTVLLKNGTYHVTHLLPDSYGAILGTSAGTILQAVSGTTGYMIALKSPASTHQVMLRDLVLVPNTGTLGGIQLDNTGLNASPMHVLTNVQVQRAGGDGFHFDNGANGLHLYGCSAQNSGGYGFYLGTGCTDSHFVSCTAAVSANHGWLVGGWNNMFTTCKSYFSGNRGGNTGSWGATQAGFYLSSCQNNTFVGCCAQNNALHGFDLQSAVNCTITGCEADGNNKVGRAESGSIPRLVIIVRLSETLDLTSVVIRNFMDSSWQAHRRARNS